MESPSPSLWFIRLNEAEFLKPYDNGKSDGPSQTHGNSERQHVPEFSVTEQLKMNRNTLFTHSCQNFFNMPSMYVLQDVPGKTSLYRKYKLNQTKVYKHPNYSTSFFFFNWLNGVLWLILKRKQSSWVEVGMLAENPSGAYMCQTREALLIYTEKLTLS